MPHDRRFKPLPVAMLPRPPSLPQVQRTAQAHEPALSLLTDLHHSACVIAHHHDSIGQTMHLMMRAGVRMVFVCGHDGTLVGMVTAEDLQGERPVLRASNHNMAHTELTVADVMLPVTQWEVMDLAEARTARLGDIVATMHEHGLRYLLVTQAKQGQTTLRGLFSARRLELALGQSIDSDLHSRSFAELESVLAH